ncbi:CocE/NonD family hydrolase [Microbacterium resistens]
MSRSPRLNRVARGDHRLLSRAAGMPAPTHPDVTVVPDIAVPAADGVTLRTDHWSAPGAGDATLLVRTPYGRADIAGMALFFAERGHHVIVQSCRGTFGSGGRFDPLHDEAADGAATMSWLRAQPWATGPVHSWGGSYFGVTQWAMVDGGAGPDALGIAVSARRFDEAILYRGGGFSIETLLAWCIALDLQERPLLSKIGRMLRARDRVHRASFTVPPTEAAVRAHAGDPAFFRDWLAHSAPGDPWWEPLHFAEELSSIPPTVLLAGWQDLFLEGQLDDYAALRDAGTAVRLVVGDWTHGAPGTLVLGAREALRGFSDPRGGAAVQVEVTGGGGWREPASWPPPSTPETWQATADGALVRDDDGAVAPGTLSYRYDPDDPTPSAGGRTLNPFTAGRRDQRRREARDDVLVFTGEELADEVLVAGSPEVELTLSSTNPRVDVFVRLCEVDERDRSTMITDSYRRLTPDAAAGEERRVRLVLAPIAHRFAPGRRLRLQVSSGAHPLHLRNPGTEDPVRDFSRLVPSAQTVRLGGVDPLRLVLPRTTDDALGAFSPAP